ncbi:MAG: DUF2878 domain-containing protein [Marinobacter sp.]|nr:DUF2878 domain-containing protein [Marinobacter sp.]
MIQSAGVRNLVNFILFQAGWFLCVVYPGGPSAVAALGLVIAHLFLVSQRAARELQFILLGTFLGSLIDSLWFHLDVMSSSTGTALWAPLWLVGIWALFMTTLAHSLAWVGRKVWLPFLLAPISGPFAYWSASRLGAVSLPDLTLSLPALALGWLVSFPLMMHIRRRYFADLLPEPTT